MSDQLQVILWNHFPEFRNVPQLKKAISYVFLFMSSQWKTEMNDLHSYGLWRLMWIYRFIYWWMVLREHHFNCWFCFLRGNHLSNFSYSSKWASLCNHWSPVNTLFTDSFHTWNDKLPQCCRSRRLWAINSPDPSMEPASILYSWGRCLTRETERGSDERNNDATNTSSTGGVASSTTAQSQSNIP